MELKLKGLTLKKLESSWRNFRCPVCSALKKKSHLRKNGTFTMSGKVDKPIIDGVTHTHNPHPTAKRFICSENHKFEIQFFEKCLVEGCDFVEFADYGYVVILRGDLTNTELKGEEK